MRDNTAVVVIWVNQSMLFKCTEHQISFVMVAGVIRVITLTPIYWSGHRNRLKAGLAFHKQKLQGQGCVIGWSVVSW